MTLLISFFRRYAYRQLSGQTLEADSIIPVMPLTSNTELAKSLEGKVPEVYPIGDGKEPRLILDAVGEGFRVARDI